MSRRLHPRPGFIVWKTIVENDGAAEGFKGSVVVLLAVLNFALQHGVGDSQDVGHGIVEENAGLDNVINRSTHQPLLVQRLRHFPTHSSGNAPPVVQQCNARAVQLTIRRKRLCQQLLPPPKPNQDMNKQRYKRLQPVGHTTFNQKAVWDLLDEIASGLDAFVVVAGKHAAKHNKVVVVGTIQSEKRVTSKCLCRLEVGHDGLFVELHCLPIPPNLHVDVGRHVNQVTSVGRNGWETLAHVEQHWPLKVWRHFHGVNVKMAQARVGGKFFQCLLQKTNDFLRVGLGLTVGRPKLPWPKVHPGLCHKAGDIAVIWKLRQQSFHLDGKRAHHRQAPFGCRGSRQRKSVPARFYQCSSQHGRCTRRGGPCCSGCCSRRCGSGSHSRLHVPRPQSPRFVVHILVVVVGRTAVRSKPMCQHTSRVPFGNMFKTSQCLLMMKGIHLELAATKGALRRLVYTMNNAAAITKIKACVRHKRQSSSRHVCAMFAHRVSETDTLA
eukprot:m.134538 g.134538  ORF g.134538 m.134538 type:complete len:495 (+) comp16916_c0_seq1:397-1881(+)